MKGDRLIAFLKNQTDTHPRNGTTSDDDSATQVIQKEAGGGRLYFFSCQFHILVTVKASCTRGCEKRCEDKKVENKARSKLEEVSVAENVIWVHIILDGLEHPDTQAGDALLHPLLPKFPNSVVV